MKEALGLDVLSSEGESSIAKTVVPIVCTVDVWGAGGGEGLEREGTGITSKNSYKC